MSDELLYHAPKSFSSSAHIDEAKYKALYKESISDPEGFWSKQAEEFVSWFSSWDSVLEWDYHKADIKWFKGAKLNVSYNCIDRHLETKGNQTAIIWEGDDPNDDKRITYNELHEAVCKFSNALKAIFAPGQPEGMAPNFSGILP